MMIATAMVLPNYLEPNYPEIEVFNIITPNGDGVHDYLTISGIDIRPNNTITIFNRWGVLVFEMQNYDGRSRRFEGISQGRATISKGEPLPVGTYFYILNYQEVDSTSKTLSGYLYIN